MKIKKIVPVLLLSSFASPSIANTPYSLAQLGFFQQDQFTSYSKHTGRLGLGYQWETAFIFGTDVNEPTYLHFNYGIELAYQKYEKTTYSSTYWTYQSQREAIDLLAILELFPTSKIDLFLKAGPSLIHEKNNDVRRYVNAFFPFYENTYSNRGIVPKVMGGFGYKITPKTNINFFYGHEFGTGIIDSASSLMLGLKYNFK